MPADATLLSVIAARVADGDAVDWDRVLRACPDPQTRGDLEALRALVAIGPAVRAAGREARRGIRWRVWLAAALLLLAM